jgi:hypothetical protein
MAFELVNQSGEGTADTVEVPASTPWPIVLAFGITLLFAGLVTSEAVSVLGATVAIAGAVGWFRDVLPYEAHETVQVAPQAPAVTTMRHEVARMEIEHELRRAWLPVEIYPISAGIKGGLAGSVAMAVLAMLYGVLSHTSIWYPINLLAAGFFPAATTDTTAEIAAFHLRAFLIAVPIHLITSLLVGLLYGAMLPMLPRRPILLGGFIAPLLWSGLMHSILGIVNPVLNQRIDWLWFVASQVGFGIVAGLVVSRQERIRTRQQLPLFLRVGLEASGMREDEKR